MQVAEFFFFVRAWQGPRLYHTETSKFDLWPDFDPRFKANLEILSMLWGDLVESFRTPPRGARYDHWFSR